MHAEAARDPVKFRVETFIRNRLIHIYFSRHIIRIEIIFNSDAYWNRNKVVYNGLLNFARP